MLDNTNKINRLNNKNLKPHYFPNLQDCNSLNNANQQSRTYFKPLQFNGIDNNSNCIEFDKKNSREAKDTAESSAYKKGFQEGEQASQKSSMLKLEPVLNNYRRAILELNKVKNEIIQNAEQKTVNLALAIAKKIVGNEVSTNKNVVENIVNKALEKVTGDERVTVKISQSDLCHFKNDQKINSDILKNSRYINFEADDNIKDGGCIIETSMGEIDARIEKQFKIVEEAFDQEMQKSPVGG